MCPSPASKLRGDPGQSMNIEFLKDDFEALHRPHRRLDRAPQIMIQFNSTRAKDKWSRASKTLRCGPKSGRLPTGIFISENLTRFSKKLSWKRKVRPIEQEYRFLWTRNGKIPADKNEDCSVLRMPAVDDV